MYRVHFGANTASDQVDVNMLNAHGGNDPMTGTRGTRKRRPLDADDAQPSNEPRPRPAHAFGLQQQHQQQHHQQHQQQPSPLAMARAIELRAFGLEDRAEAVMAVDGDHWRLDRLSRWRQEHLHTAPPINSPSASTPQEPSSQQLQQQQQQQQQTAYLRERQRAYRQHLLHGGHR